MPGPAELGLHKDGVSAGEVCTGDGLSVGNLFPPLDAKNPPEAGGMEVVQLPCMTLVDYPCFAAVQKGGENCSLVYLDLGLGCDASPIPDLFVSLPKAALALASLAFSSSSMMMNLERVLPRSVNSSTMFSLCPLTVMVGSTYGLPGAGWCRTSVFLALIVRLKFLQASTNLPMLCCMLASEAALRVQSSANKKSLMVLTLTLVFALSLLRLKSEPSERYLIPMPTTEFLKASDSIAENMTLKNLGARTHPCFIP